MGIHGISSGYGRYPNLLTTSSTEESRRSSVPNLLDILNNQQNDGGDILEISAEAQMLANMTDALSGGLLAGAGSLLGDLGGGTVSFKDLHQQSLSSVRGRLQALFDENDIDTTRPIDLQVGPDGRLIVANDHPQKAEIEELVNSNETLRNEFARLSSLTRLIAAGREAAEFQAAYAKDPRAAVAQYSYLFDSAIQPTVTLRILGDQYESLYLGASGKTITVGGSDR